MRSLLVISPLHYIEILLTVGILEQGCLHLNTTSFFELGPNFDECELPLYGGSLEFQITKAATTYAIHMMVTLKRSIP